MGSGSHKLSPPSVYPEFRSWARGISIYLLICLRLARRSGKGKCILMACGFRWNARSAARSLSVRGGTAVPRARSILRRSRTFGIRVYPSLKGTIKDCNRQRLSDEFLRDYFREPVLRSTEANLAGNTPRPTRFVHG